MDLTDSQIASVVVESMTLLKEGPDYRADSDHQQ